MRKKTVPKSRQGRSVAPTQPSGLIARGKSSLQSGVGECALDNRSHRTTLRISCRRTPFPLLDAFTVADVTVRTNQLFPKRLPASCACHAALSLRQCIHPHVLNVVIVLPNTENEVLPNLQLRVEVRMWSLP